MDGQTTPPISGCVDASKNCQKKARKKQRRQRRRTLGKSLANKNCQNGERRARLCDGMQWGKYYQMRGEKIKRWPTIRMCWGKAIER